MCMNSAPTYMEYILLKLKPTQEAQEEHSILYLEAAPGDTMTRIVDPLIAPNAVLHIEVTTSVFG